MDRSMDPEVRSRVLALAGVRLDPESRRQPYPGQRYKHGWIPIAPGVDAGKGDAENDDMEYHGPSELADRIMREHPGVELSLGGSGKRISVSLIRTAESGRGQGKAAAAMVDLLAAADRHGLTVTLTPEPLAGDKKTSQSRLREWYKSLGFIENKGRNKDYEISAGMYRLPRK